uniref:Alba domain-containing protein n=1 Tax=Caenorhabditis japonica TaxID=281687 RepID=A0A8R1IA42_CAEJA
MDNYVPADESTEEASNPFPAPYNSADAKIMVVSKSTKFPKIIGHVREHFDTHPDHRFVVFKSTNGATERAISCVEVLKQQFAEQELYQWTKVVCDKRVSLWKCLQEGPRDIRVTVEVPVVFIVISRDPFQGEHSCMSMQCSTDKDISFSFLPPSQSGGKSKKERKGNRKQGEGNKWTKPSSDQRRKEHKEREEALKELQNS